MLLFPLMSNVEESNYATEIFWGMCEKVLDALFLF